MLLDSKNTIILASDNIWKQGSGIFNLLNRISYNFKKEYNIIKFDRFGIVKFSLFRNLIIYLYKKLHNYNFQIDLESLICERKPLFVDVKIENFMIKKPISRMTKFIGRSHGIFFELNDQKKKNISSFLKYAHKIVLPHEGDIETLEILEPELFKIHKKKIIIMPSFIEDRLRDRLNKNHANLIESYNNNYIVFLGSWSNRKGSSYIPKIIKNIFDNNNKTKFLFLGTNVTKNDLLSAFKPKNREMYTDRIRIVKKFNKYNELGKLLKIVKVAILPSNFEGSPSSILELMAAKIPIISFNLPGVRNFLKNYEDQLLVPCFDLDNFNYKLNKFLKMEKDVYCKIGNNLRIETKNYSEKIFIKKYKNILIELKNNL